LTLTFCLNASAIFAHDENHQRAFVKSLYYEKYYFRAITEALRFVFDYPESPYVGEMKILIGDSYSNGGDEEKALSHYLTFVRKYPDSKYVPEVFFRIGKLYAGNRDYDSAKDYFIKILSHQKTSASLMNKSHKWMILLSLLLEKSDEDLKKLMEQYQLSSDQHIMSMVEEYHTQNFKSPTTAGILAVIPGAGHLYIGRKRDALSAFILNGLFIWGAIESFDSNHNGLGVLLVAFGSGWYAGNIYSAINGSYKHNRKKRDSFRNRFSVELNLNVSRSNEGFLAPVLLFSYRY
jgi:tetratricopeptide (TPR) repeat protein